MLGSLNCSLKMHRPLPEQVVVGISVNWGGFSQVTTNHGPYSGQGCKCPAPCGLKRKEEVLMAHGTSTFIECLLCAVSGDYILANMGALIPAGGQMRLM